jgi:hypothetical protein
MKQPWLSAYVIRQTQALNHFAVLQMGFDDLVNVVLIHIGVPNRFWINHHDWTACAAIQAAGLIDTNAAMAMDTQLFNAGFAMFPGCLSGVV